MSINISELIWTVICFFVLLVVLKKLLFDPLVSFMAARDARIQDGLNAGRTAQQQLDAAARARSEAQRKQAAAADALLAEAKSAVENQVSIAMPPLYSFAGLQARLRESCPDVSVRITHTRIKDLPGALLSGEVDFCIRAARVDDPRLSCRELTDDRLIMIVPPTHPLAGREQVHLSAFRNDTFVNFSRSSGEAPNVTDLEFYCRQIGFEPRIVLWSPNMREILESVRNGVGAAMVPLRVLSGYSVEDLCCLQLSEPDCWTHLRLYALKNVREMPAVKRVRRCIEAYFDAEK